MSGCCCWFINLCYSKTAVETSFVASVGRVRFHDLTCKFFNVYKNFSWSVGLAASLLYLFCWIVLRKKTFCCRLEKLVAKKLKLTQHDIICKLFFVKCSFFDKLSSVKHSCSKVLLQCQTKINGMSQVRTLVVSFCFAN